jgi:hypothetical protein
MCALRVAGVESAMLVAKSESAMFELNDLVKDVQVNE